MRLSEIRFENPQRALKRGECFGDIASVLVYQSKTVQAVRGGDVIRAKATFRYFQASTEKAERGGLVACVPKKFCGIVQGVRELTAFVRWRAFKDAQRTLQERRRAFKIALAMVSDSQRV